MKDFSSYLKQKIKLTTFSPKTPSSKEEEGDLCILPFFSVEHFKSIQMFELMENWQEDTSSRHTVKKGVT